MDDGPLIDWRVDVYEGRIEVNPCIIGDGREGYPKWTVAKAIARAVFFSEGAAMNVAPYRIVVFGDAIKTADLANVWGRVA